MASMKKVLNSQFWNEEVESSRTLDAVVHTLPHSPPPVSLVRSSRLFRSQQLLLLQRLFSFPFTPSFSDGAFSLDRVVATAGGLRWWATLTARARTNGLISILRTGNEETGFNPSRAKQWITKAKQVLCHSLYVIGTCSRLTLGPNTTLSATCEANDALGYLLSCNHILGDSEKPWHGHASLRQKLRRHDVLLKLAWNKEYLDSTGNYWKMPEMASLDLVSLGSSSGLRYRLGVHHSSYGMAEEGSSQVSVSALAGTRGRAAVSIEKELDLWKDTKLSTRKPYNLIASHPHVSISGIIGGILSADIFRKGKQNYDGLCLKSAGRLFAADAFASVGLSAQLGHFQKPLLDLSKMSVRMDLRSASTFLKTASDSGNDGCYLPTLEITLQQQVAGPVRAQIDSTFAADLFATKKCFQIQDVTYGLDCSLESSGAARLVIWYSPKRREGMVELRVLEK